MNPLTGAYYIPNGDIYIHFPLVLVIVAVLWMVALALALGSIVYHVSGKANKPRVQETEHTTCQER